MPPKKYAASTPQTSTLPGVDSPDETGEVARVSVPKGGRAVEPAAVALLPRNDNKKAAGGRQISSVSVSGRSF